MIYLENINQELKLYKEYFNKVLDGSKKSTSRKGIRDIKQGALRIKMTEKEDEVIVVNVTKVKYMSFANLDEYEAFMEGYSSADELKQRLINIYGELNPDDAFTFIEWE